MPVNMAMPFATNFNPEINIREVTAKGALLRIMASGLKPNLCQYIRLLISRVVSVPRKSICMYHEELESLVKNIKGVKRIRFWMTFSENHI